VPAAIAGAVLLGVAAIAAYPEGPPPAHTGGFGEPTCHSCHFDFPLDSGPAVLELGAPDTYGPGDTYALVVMLERPGLAAGGFQLSARFASGPAAGRQAGKLLPLDDRVTVRYAPDSASIAYANQTATGSRAKAVGALDWRLAWVAPDEARGPVVFHVVANAANDDASEFGDHIHTDSLTVPPRSQRGPAHFAGAPQETATTAELRGISAAGPNVIWACGRGGVFTRSADTGASWSAGRIPGAEELFLIDIHAVSADTAFVLGTHFDGGLGIIYKTTDGGRSWVEQYRAEAAGVFFDGMAFWDAQHGVAFSDPVEGAFLVVTTDDGGASWRRVPPENIPAPLQGEAGFAASGTAITVHGDRDVWFGTGGASVARVFHSGDRGRTWTVSPTPLPAGPTAGVFGIAFRDARRGVAVGGDHRRPDEATANVARTIDGGRTWNLVGSAAPAGVRYGVAYSPGAESDALVAVGPSGWGYSRDDGESWALIERSGYNTVAATSDGHAWVGGVGGRISRLRLQEH